MADRPILIGAEEISVVTETSIQDIVMTDVCYHFFSNENELSWWGIECMSTELSFFGRKHLGPPKAFGLNLTTSGRTFFSPYLRNL
jgi:hypothetical protein